MPSEFEVMLEQVQTYPEFSEGYNIEVYPSEADEYWQCEFVYHLSGAENNGRHHCFVATFDENNNFVNMPIRWYWNGIGDNETHPVPLNTGDKNWPIECANIVLQGNYENGIRLWVDDTIESDIVDKVSSRWADEESGNTWGHHSFFVGFKKVTNGYEPPEEEPNELIDLIKATLLDLEDDLESLKMLVNQL